MDLARKGLHLPYGGRELEVENITRVRQAFMYFQRTQQLGNDYRTGFTFGGITFEEYRGQATDASGNVRKFIADDEAHFFPIGTVNTFRAFFAPADFAVEPAADLPPAGSAGQGGQGVRAVAFIDLADAIDTACLSVFGTPVTFTPQDGSGPQQIAGIVRSPAIGEDFVPGSLQGTAVVRLFVRFASLSPQPRHGDTVTINGLVYDVVEVEADVAGGAVLKLRAT